MDVHSVAIRFVVDPVSLVYVAIDMDELSLAVRSVVFPITFVARAVRPDLFAKPVAEAANPLPEISSPRFEGVELSILPFGVRIIDGLAYGFFLLVQGEVAAVCPLCLPDESHLLPR